MRRSFHRLAFAALASATGCAAVIGFPDYTSSTSGTGASGGATSSTSTSTSSTTTTGTGGSSACVPDAGCYLGLDGTEGVGTCQSGTDTCQGGVATCNGDVRPTVQACDGDAGLADTNCDGIPGCTGQLRWQASGLPASFSSIAAGQDGTVALGGNSTAGFFVQTFDAHGRPCRPAPTVFSGGGQLTLNAVAISGAKTSADGRIEQARCPGDATTLAAQTVVVGNAMGAISFGPGKLMTSNGTEGFVAVLDPGGRVAWGTLFGSVQADDVRAVATDPKGAIYLTGGLGSALTALPCTVAADGGSPLGDAGAPAGASVIVAKLEADGTCDWVDLFPGDGVGTGIAVDHEGNVAVVGTLSGSVTFGSTSLTASDKGFLLRLSPTGDVDGVLDLGCPTAHPPKVAISPTPSSFDIFALCDIDQGLGCGGTSGGPVQSILAIVGSDLTVTADICYTATAGDVAIASKGVAVDDAGSVVVLLSTTGPLTSPGFANTIPPGGAVAFKLTSPYADYTWATGFGTAASLDGPMGVAVDGMGDVVVGVAVAAAVSSPPVTLPVGAAVVELAP